VCDLETSRMGAPYIYDVSRLRVNRPVFQFDVTVLCEGESYDLFSRSI